MADKPRSLDDFNVLRKAFPDEKRDRVVEYIWDMEDAWSTLRKFGLHIYADDLGDWDPVSYEGTGFLVSSEPFDSEEEAQAEIDKLKGRSVADRMEIIEAAKMRHKEFYSGPDY